MRKKVILALLCIVLNIAGKHAASVLSLPLWLDAFGTCLAAYALGPLPAAVVGALTNCVYTLVSPYSVFYAVVSVMVAVIVGFLARRGWMDSFLRTMSLAMVVTVASISVSSVLDVLFHDGTLGNMWGDGIVEMLGSWHVPFALCILAGEFYVDFLDKVMTLGLLYVLVRLYRKAKPLLPRSLALFPAAVFLLVPAHPQEAAANEADVPDYHSYVRTVYNNQNGLPGGEANDIASTPDGILWVGTYGGLYRHNGYEFRLMNGLSSVKNVNCLYTAPDGLLFVGTNDNGLSVVRDEEVVCMLSEADGLPSDSVRSIAHGSDGFYYVGTSGALAVVELSDGALSVRGTVGSVVYAKSLAADSVGNVAAVTDGGSLFLLSGGAVVREERTGKAYTAVSFGADGHLYAATTGNELFEFSADGGFSLLESVQCSPLAHINSMREEGPGMFLCADNGAALLDGSHVLHVIPTGTFNNSIDCMMTDYQGNIWFSSSRLGLLKMCESAFTEVYVSAGFEETVVNSVARFGGGLYFATDSGLSFVDDATGKALENGLTRRLSSVRIRCLMVDSEGSLWICTAGAGVLRVGTDGTVMSYGAAGQRFRTALQLSDGSVAAAGDNGILFIQDGKVTGSITAADGLENARVLTLTEAADGTLLCGTDGGGLALVQNRAVVSHIRKRDGLSSDVILRTVPDGDGVFLVTSNGLCYLDGGYSVRTLGNFPYSNNYDLVQTEDGTLFVLGSAGIYVVSKADLLSGGKVDYELLDVKKGLTGSLTANSWNYLDDGNNLYLSCDTGASRLNLDSYDRGEKEFRIRLKAVVADGERMSVRKSAGTGEPVVVASGTDTVELVPEVINYSINNAYVSLYMEGVDDHANVMLQSELSSIIYTNLAPGTYRLHLGILDSKGRATLSESVYTIVKEPRIYDYWWFRVYAAAVLVLAVIWLTWYLTALYENRKRTEQEKELSLVRRQVQMGNETIFTIANAVEARDTRTGHHSFRVAEYSVLIAKELGFSQQELENLHKTALLHDIGKIGIPDAILNKPGKLTPEEYDVMKTHVDRGGEILKNFTLIEHVADGAKYHHERYDGTGYNTGLKGDEIPLNARIIGIADAFDAMTAERVYRKTLDIESVKAELVRCRGTQFDPALTDIMLRLIEDGTLNVDDIYKRSEAAKG